MQAYVKVLSTSSCSCLFPLFDLLFIHPAAFTPLGFICVFGLLGSVNFLVFDLGSLSVLDAAVTLPEEEHR